MFLSNNQNHTPHEEIVMEIIEMRERRTEFIVINIAQNFPLVKKNRAGLSIIYAVIADCVKTHSLFVEKIKDDSACMSNRKCPEAGKLAMKLVSFQPRIKGILSKNSFFLFCLILNFFWHFFLLTRKFWQIENFHVNANLSMSQALFLFLLQILFFA